MTFSLIYQEIIASLSPVFEFMGQIWSAVPLPVRFVFICFFGFCIGFVILRNFLS